jgi:ABC-type transport system substrate-binding protein
MNGNNAGLRLAAPSSRTVLRTLCLTLIVVGIMLASSIVVGVGFAQPRGATAAQIGSHLTPSGASAPAAYSYPTTTFQEPNYTGGKYIMGSDVDVEHLNVYAYSDLYSGMLIDELYDSADAYTVNQTYIPWAASSWVETAAHAGSTVYDPLTASMQPVAYTYNVTLRPGIQWSDYNAANAADTYVYSNYTSFSLYNSTSMAPEAYTHTYPWPSVRMNTETIQSADLILSWEIMVSSVDYSSQWANIVDVSPVNNLTAEFYLSSQSATFVTATLGNPILPYHVWVSHDWADSNPAAWNFTGTNAPNGYDSWDVGYNPATGTSNDLIGSGPFLFTNYAGQPSGVWIPGEYWELYVNPYYWVQYVPGYHQYTPRIDEIYTPLYGTESAAVAALALGQVDTILNGVDPTFIPTVDAIAGTSIFYQPSGSIGFIAFEPTSTNAPFNVTAFRQALNYATNKAYLASVVDEGYQQLGQPTVPVADSVWHNFSAPQYSYDPAEAQTLIGSIPGMTKNGAGNWVYDGTPVSADIQITVASEDPLAVEGTLLVAEEWSSIGVPTTVTQEAFSTLVSNLIAGTFNTITLGITGLQGDPTAFFLDAYNSNIGTGTGFYEGPFSSLVVNGVSLNGTQVTDLMNNLTIELNSVANFTQRLNIAYEIEGIAAEESCYINLGYPVLILPFANGTFSGLIRDSLAYATFMYWNFLSFYEKTFVPPTPPAQIPVQLHAAIVQPATGNVFYDGQFGNLTVQVRNQYGSPVAGANVSLGYNPTGALLNVTSNHGLTNAQGQYTWEFQVLGANPLVYTSDYSGEINVSVAATAPPGASGTYVPSLGWTYIDVAPYAVAYKEVTPPPTLQNGAAPAPVTIEVYNPVTGNPITGYSYTLEALSGAVNLTSGIAGQTVTTTSSFSPIFGVGFASVMVADVTDYDLTEINGVTGANGLITVDLQANSSVNWTAEGQVFESWLFVGSYGAGAPLVGEPPFSLIAQITSAYDSTGYGVDEPVEIPLILANVTPSVDLTVTATSSVNATSSGTVTVTATNATSHLPIAGYTVTLTSQNAEGANRGILANPAGTPVEASTPNAFFGSAFIPGIVLTTNATGVATATFSPGLYVPGTAGGVFVGYSSVPFTDKYLIPFDEFEISATGAGSTVASTTVVSNGTAAPSLPTPVVSAYIGGAGSLNGVTVVQGNATYPLYVNSTLNSPWGPAVGSISVNLTTTLGTIAAASGTTSSAGSYATTFSAPAVTVLTSAVVGITSGGVAPAASTQVYILPSFTTTLPGKTTTTTTTDMTEVYEVAAVAVILAILAVAFAVLWARGRSKQPPIQKWSDEEAKPSTTSTGGTGESAGGTPGGPGGSAPPP